MAESTVTDRELQQAVRRWLQQNWTPDAAEALRNRGSGWETPQALKDWLARVVEAGSTVPRWPSEWFGREMHDAQARIIEREFARVKAPGTGQDRVNLWANTLLASGPDSLKQKLNQCDRAR